MRFSYQSILFHSIDVKDARFRISTPGPIDDLVDAIDRIGLLYPPILYETMDGVYIVVAGFKRILACRRLGRTGIEARIMPGDTSALDCLSIAVADNTLHRDINLTEQSIALSKLSAFYGNDVDLSHAARRLGMEVNPGLVKKLLRINTLSGPLQQAILSGAIPLSIALGLDAISSPLLAKRLIAVFEQLRPTLNQQKELLQWVQDLARIDPAGGADLLSDEACRGVLTDGDLDRPRKIRGLMDILKRRRFPVIAAFVDQYRQKMRKLSLPQGMSMIPPDDFEADRHRVVLDFQSLEQLEIQIAGLHALARDSDFLSMINKDFEDFNPLH
jgi:ParB-like chromosome segregation protein Spo0J